MPFVATSRVREDASIRADAAMRLLATITVATCRDIE